ncbi:flagellar hook capping FlgD N-terminal domain-containing protein [Ruegeria sp. Ofav3-42]|uniref:flagellar hook capping FlgD N-terminal domain-containing protein n=1 Tax=Ruegeria sp. Ofav3-42 TaxID=2917759 RepID=UPI001EF69CA9|nr:flagellar hook capping FlgD N-terminal domain-containing protein [Ruegeria sp. Ofav3-42]MCG7520614.1 flagellar biosynthesis protein FlgD [Ruegeria sp. Ofav3-42]
MIAPTQRNSQTPVQSQIANTQKSSGLASDFETFLKMLTVQAQNQDPLKPLDASEYASQLAQFSMVEQQVQTNDLLSALSQTLGGANLDKLGKWIGMNVRTPSAFSFDGEPVDLFAKAEPAADKAVMVIRESGGTVVDRITVSTTDTKSVWSGKGSDGQPLAAGNYTATLESYGGDKLLSQQLAAAYNQVVEAQISENQVMLTLVSGHVVSATTVTGVRAGA